LSVTLIVCGLAVGPVVAPHPVEGFAGPPSAGAASPPGVRPASPLVPDEAPELPAPLDPVAPLEPVAPPEPLPTAPDDPPDADPPPLDVVALGAAPPLVDEAPGVPPLPQPGGVLEVVPHEKAATEAARPAASRIPAYVQFRLGFIEATST
jgi:hypothetical protein